MCAGVVVPLLAAPAGFAAAQPLAAGQSGGPVSVATATAGDAALGNARSEAASLTSQLATENARINALAEQYDLAQVQQAALQQRMSVEQAALAVDRQKLAAARLVATHVAVDAYENSGTPLATIDQLLKMSQGSYGLAVGFLESAATSQQSAVQQLRSARSAVKAQESRLQAAQAAELRAAQAAQTASAAASAAVAQQKATLSQVNGHISQLVAADVARAIAARRAAALAAERRAAEAAARRQAALAAQQAASLHAAAVAAESAGGGGSAAGSGSGSGSGSAPSGGGGGVSGIAGLPPAGVGLGSGGYVPPVTVSGPVPAPMASAGTAVATALAQVGKPYQWGAAGPSSFDCSGLVMTAWQAAGVSLLHYTVYQWDETVRIGSSQLAPGDLVFYTFPGEPDPGHVVMYIGNGQVVAADTTGVPVRVESMYADGTPVGFGRVTASS
ncbi:MAG: C40 family peptidase [Actinomycetota bacterium]|nr:C40 family peptidase [Actinomycetota bacterium]